MHDPLVIEVTRGAVVESRHHVLAAVVDPSGHVLRRHGESDRRFPVRSAIKSLQALPLVESGALSARAVSTPELSIACGSHNGEADHIATVRSWLARLDLADDDLGCGPSYPYGEEAARSVVASGGGRQRPQHNCSGKHCGFLTLARHLGAPTDGYLALDHPVQQQVLQALTESCGVAVDEVTMGVDGCGAPVAALSTTELARGLASLPKRAPAIAEAIMAEPWFMAGTGRPDTRLTTALAGRGYTKTGAEGVHAASIIDEGVGIVVKALDGGRRASVTAIVHLLGEVAGLDLDGELADLARPTIVNSNGLAVGEIRLVS